MEEFYHASAEVASNWMARMSRATMDLHPLTSAPGLPGNRDRVAAVEVGRHISGTSVVTLKWPFWGRNFRGRNFTVSIFGMPFVGTSNLKWSCWKRQFGGPHFELEWPFRGHHFSGRYFRMDILKTLF